MQGISRRLMYFDSQKKIAFSVSYRYYAARRLRSTRRRIIGVRISCIASPILPPGATMLLGRVIHESSRRTLERYAERCRGVHAEVDVVEGKADLAILEAARVGPADLLVLGRGRRHGLVGLHPGSVVSRVLVAAACPVLVVPH